MIERKLIKCGEKCSMCDIVDCEIREKAQQTNLNNLFENVENELQLLTSNNVVASLISSIHLLRDSEADQIMFIAQCIEPHIKFLLHEVKGIDEAKKTLIISNLNEFLYHIANEIICTNKKEQKILTKKMSTQIVDFATQNHNSKTNF